MPSLFEFTRLALCAALIYAVVPRLIFGRGDGLARGVAHLAFFLQVAAMILGDWKLYLPGSFAALFLLWCVVAWLLLRRRGLPHGRRILAAAMEWLEDKRTRAQPLEESVARARGHWSHPATAALAVTIAATSLSAVWFGLHNVRLWKLDSYSRALSLHTLTRGELWNHDASVALLAPLVWLSGLGPDQAIRLSGALVAAALLLATAYAGWRLTNDVAGAVWPSAILAVFMVALRLTPTEPGAAELAAVFVVLSGGLAGRAWGASGLAAVTALLIYPGLSPLPLLAAASLTIASLLPRAATRVPAFAALAVLICVAAHPPRAAAPEHQYEAAARTAHRIAREFRTNDWVVISPGLEVAQTYGRGWHVELADFVASHSEGEVARSGFRFPFEAQSAFIFVEKRVLPQPAFSFTHDSGPAPYYYSTNLGRASLEFRAARLMAAYRSAHRDAQVYFEDEDLIVYRIDRGPALTAAAQF